jgi:hypothetical protein
MATIQLKRGLHANLPTSGMAAGEPLITTDRGTLYVATDATTKIPVVPAVDALSALGTMATDDLILIHDTSGNAATKCTFSAFKTALNIPTGDGDEKVAVASGGTAGYIWGTSGSDGILRMGSSMSWAKDSGSAFVTLNVSAVDGGTFV